MDIKKHKILLGLLPFIFLVAAFEILPLINIINNSLMDSEKNIYSFKQYITALGSPFILQSIKNSIKIALFSTLLGMIIALGAAYSISNLKPAARERVLMLSNMTSNFAGVPLAFAFIILMGNNGLFTLLLQKMGLNIFEGFDLYSGLGLIIVYIYFQVPLGILLMYPAFDGIKEGSCKSFGCVLCGILAIDRHSGASSQHFGHFNCVIFQLNGSICNSCGAHNRKL